MQRRHRKRSPPFNGSPIVATTEAIKRQTWSQDSANGTCIRCGRNCLAGGSESGSLLTLPARWGGKGLPVPEANAEITLAPSTSRRCVTADPASAEMVIRNGTKRYADYLWRAWKLILEYDSDEFHASREKLGADSARRLSCSARLYRGYSHQSATVQY